MQELANSSEKNDKNDKSKLSTGTPLPFYVTQSGQPTQPTQSGQPAQQLQSARPVNASQSSLSTQPVFSVRFSATKPQQDTDTSSSDACGAWSAPPLIRSGDRSHPDAQSLEIGRAAHDALVLALVVLLALALHAQHRRASLARPSSGLRPLGKRWETVQQRHPAASGGLGVPSRWVRRPPVTSRPRGVVQLCVDGVGHGV